MVHFSRHLLVLASGIHVCFLQLFEGLITLPVLFQDEESLGSLKKKLAELFELSLRVTVPTETDVEPLVAACTGNFGDYQW